MLTLDRYALRQVTVPMLGSLGILLLLVTSYNAANALRDTVNGYVAANQILLFLAVRDVIALEVLLPTAFYLSVVMVIAASHRNREAFALYASGIDPLRSTRVIWVLALGVGVAVALLSNFARPWSYRTSYELTQASSELTVDAMQPGHYYTWRDLFIITAERVRREEGILEGVFAQSRSEGSVNVIRAQTGRIAEQDAESRWFLFEDGTSYQIDAASNTDRTAAFARLYYRAADFERRSVATKRRARPTQYLAKSTKPKEIAEFQWRMSMPLVAFLVGLIGIQLGRTPVGRTPYARIALAVVLYAVIFNVLQIARIAVENAQLPAFPGVYSVPAVILVVYALMSRVPAFSLRRPPP